MKKVRSPNCSGLGNRDTRLRLLFLIKLFSKNIYGKNLEFKITGQVNQAFLEYRLKGQGWYGLTCRERFKMVKKWRKCMGIEPTRDGSSAPHRI